MRGGGPHGPYGAPRAPEGTGGTPRGTGTPPEARGTPPEARGAFLEKLTFRPPALLPPTPPKPSQYSLPSLWDLSQSLRAAFLVQAATKNASGASTGPQNHPRGRREVCQSCREVCQSWAGWSGMATAICRVHPLPRYGEYIVLELPRGVPQPRTAT